MDTKTKRILDTCDARLIHLFTEVDKYRPFTIGTYGGHRTAEMQYELWKKGRTLQEGKWIVVGPTVTNCDGTNTISKHQHYPSKAVDVWIIPLDWEEIEKWQEFVRFVYGIADYYGIKVKNLGDSIGDWPHWEVD